MQQTKWLAKELLPEGVCVVNDTFRPVVLINGFRGWARVRILFVAKNGDLEGAKRIMELLDGYFTECAPPSEERFYSMFVAYLTFGVIDFLQWRPHPDGGWAAECDWPEGLLLIRVRPAPWLDPYAATDQTQSSTAQPTQGA